MTAPRAARISSLIVRIFTFLKSLALRCFELTADGRIGNAFYRRPLRRATLKTPCELPSIICRQRRPTTAARSKAFRGLDMRLRMR
jgi:hypothetical protein